MQFYEINIKQIITFRLYTVYNKHEMMEIRNQTTLLEKFRNVPGNFWEINVPNFYQ